MFLTNQNAEIVACILLVWKPITHFIAQRIRNDDDDDDEWRRPRQGRRLVKEGIYSVAPAGLGDTNRSPVTIRTESRACIEIETHAILCSW